MYFISDAVYRVDAATEVKLSERERTKLHAMFRKTLPELDFIPIGEGSAVRGAASMLAPRSAWYYLYLGTEYKVLLRVRDRAVLRAQLLTLTTKDGLKQYCLPNFWGKELEAQQDGILTSALPARIVKFLDKYELNIAPAGGVTTGEILVKPLNDGLDVSMVVLPDNPGRSDIQTKIYYMWVYEDSEDHLVMGRAPLPNLYDDASVCVGGDSHSYERSLMSDIFGLSDYMFTSLDNNTWGADLPPLTVSLYWLLDALPVVRTLHLPGRTDASINISYYMRTKDFDDHPHMSRMLPEIGIPAVCCRDTTFSCGLRHLLSYHLEKPSNKKGEESK